MDARPTEAPLRTDIYERGDVRESLQRAAPGPGDDTAHGTLASGEIEIKLGEGLVRASGRVLTLSVREFQLLVVLVRHAGGILRREELYAQVWGRELRDGDRSVDVYVSKLRSKLETAMPGKRLIHTHPGFGYRFQQELSRNLDNGATTASQTAPGEPS